MGYMRDQSNVILKSGKEQTKVYLQNFYPMDSLF